MFSRFYSTLPNLPSIEKESVKRAFSKSNLSFQPPPLQKTPLLRRILHIRRVARVNSGGKIRSVSALVITGNGNGVGGFGIGRATDLTRAVQKATLLAEKNMSFIPRFENRTVYSDKVHEFMKMKLHIRTATPGHGIVAHDKIHEICRIVGISDISVNIQGSKNPINLTRAFFDAIREQKTPQDIARLRGKRVMDIEQTYYGFQSFRKKNITL